MVLTLSESMDAPMVKQDGEDTRGEKYRIKRRGSRSETNLDFLVDERAIQQARAEFAKMHAKRKSEIQMTRINVPHNVSSVLSGKPQKKCSPSLIEERTGPYDVTQLKERSSSMDDTHAEEVDNEPTAKDYLRKKGLTRQLTANAKLESVRRKSVNFFNGAIKAFKRENRALSFTSPLQLPSKYPPGIISCTDPRRIGWDIHIMLLLFYIALVTPIRIGFDQEARLEDDPFFFYLEKYIDILFILDIFVNFCTTYFDDDDKEIKLHSKIAITYCKSWFALDFISSIPFDWFMENEANLANVQAAKTAKVAKAGRAGKIVKVTRVLKLTKLLRLAKGSKMYTKYMDYFQLTRIQLKLGQLFIMTLLIAHISACLFALVGKLNTLVYLDMNEYQESWIATAGLMDAHWFEQWTTAFYFVVATITTVGYGDVSPETPLEKSFVSLLMMFGGAFYGFIIASLASLLASWDINKTVLEGKMDGITNYMKIRKFPRQLYRKVRSYYRHYYNKKTALDEQAILADLSSQLRREVVDFMVSDMRGQILTQVPMFEGLDHVYLAHILTLLKPLTVSVGEYVVKEGERGTEMFILMSGLLHVTTKETGEMVLTELHPGACFGELAALGLKPVRSASVVAAEYSELYSLSKEAIYEAFQNDFNLIDTMISKAAESIRKLASHEYRRLSKNVSEVIDRGSSRKHTPHSRTASLSAFEMVGRRKEYEKKYVVEGKDINDNEEPLDALGATAKVVKTKEENEAVRTLRQELSVFKSEMLLNFEKLEMLMEGIHAQAN